jgi:hypothetical protein
MQAIEEERIVTQPDVAAVTEPVEPEGATGPSPGQAMLELIERLRDRGLREVQVVSHLGAQLGRRVACAAERGDVDEVRARSETLTSMMSAIKR